MKDWFILLAFRGALTHCVWGLLSDFVLLSTADAVCIDVAERDVFNRGDMGHATRNCPCTFVIASALFTPK